MHDNWTNIPLIFDLQNWLSYQFTCLQVLDFLKAKENFISILLKHLGTSAIMDLTLKLMTQVEGAEVRQNILNVTFVIMSALRYIINWLCYSGLTVRNSYNRLCRY